MNEVDIVIKGSLDDVRAFVEVLDKLQYAFEDIAVDYSDSPLNFTFNQNLEFSRDLNIEFDERNLLEAISHHEQ